MEPLLVKAAQILTPTVTAEPVVSEHGLSTSKPSLFGAPASTAEGLLLAELSLFRRLDVQSKEIICPLVWWSEQESRFPAVAYIARQFLGIPGSEMECERIFSIAGILTSLRRSRLGTTNLDALIMIQKNWPFDVRTHCLSQQDVAEFFNNKAELLDTHEDELIAAGEFE